MIHPDERDIRPVSLYAGLAVAVLVSAALLWLVSDSVLLAAGFGTALGVLLGALIVLVKPRSDVALRGELMPDWSVTVAAIEHAQEAIAITDRANRLVCANRAYRDAFGIDAAPPNLDLQRPAVERLVSLARAAWRDGSAEVEKLSNISGTPDVWRVEAKRAGRGEDYLLWRFCELAEEDVAQTMGARITGTFGRLLTASGIEAAVVGVDGIVRAVSPGFAERASGDANATLAGQDFVGFLRSDERDRIYFAREGRRGSPQTLIEVALDESTATVAGPQGRSGPALMLMIDSGVGIGGGWEGAAAGNMPQLESLLGALPLGLAMTDRDGRFLFANPSFLRAVGRYDRGLPQYPSDLTVREDKGALADAVRRFGKGPASTGDMAVRLRDTPDEPVSLGLAGVRGLGDAAVLLSIADSTEETRLKRQVAQATKMQAVGQLAGGVAHDFNNVLTAIIGTCDLMLLRHTPGDSDYDDIQQIRANSNRAASLTRQLLAFSRQQTLRPEVLQLPDVMSEVSQLLKRLMGEKVQFSVRHDRDLGPVRADPQQLEQVIVNLAVNARDAMLESGDGPRRLEMLTRRVDAKDVRQMGSEIIPVGDYTVLVVQDTGRGIPQENLGKIFEPFFTTKDLGKGTGLGLSTVYGIVKQSGGFIFAENVEGGDASRPTVKGARFTVYLPVHLGEAPEAAPETSASPASEWSGGGRLLLVEDEDMVRAVAERALVRAGYEVTSCADGEEGLATFRNDRKFDMVVSDVVMPGMDGPAMARGIRTLAPKMPFLFMSGYAEEQLRRDIDIDNMHFMPKPFSVQQISDKVGDIMSRTRTSNEALQNP
ncbi:Histidine kinase [Alteripontixanthobacter maritimus]|uniref:histidine kinase n=1 Tax=Alteripontixanthobacter maritimus TaxID=2161824 RepID=A0A369Q5R0_9SPHN|nr:response regulator [Alteripontixanthobacter maritimus]RDC60221.1 Histidine kinase [Alteripontixanthobacter maritimus]